MNDTLLIFTCQPESMDLALNELQNGTLIQALGGHAQGIRGALVETLAPGIFVHRLEAPRAEALASIQALDPIFIRHLHPVDAELAWGGEHLPAELQQALTLRGPLALQLTTTDPALDNAQLATALEEQLQAAGVAVDPQAETILSVTATGERLLLGLSTVGQNLSAWPGGRVRYRRREAQVSRAGFKLEEALELWGEEAGAGKQALDLGAAPGSWTQVLRGLDYEVLAVDPAALDSRLEGDGGIRYFSGKSEDWLKKRDRSERYDLIVNDMKMDVVASAELMVELSEALVDGGRVIMTFKLPAKKQAAKIRAGLAILSEAYSGLRAKQLYHNRSEITVSGYLAAR